MVQQVLTPGMQHREETDLGTEMPWIGGDLQQCLGNGAEQQSVEQPLILEGQRRELFGHSEDHVAVRNRQQLFGSLRQPTITGRGLALGAVPVAAGVVGDYLVRAMVTLLNVPAQGSRPAGSDVAEGFPLLWGDGVSPSL